MGACMGAATTATTATTATATVTATATDATDTTATATDTTATVTAPVTSASTATAKATAMTTATAKETGNVRHRLTDVLGKWWCSHGPVGKRLLGTLLLDRMAAEKTLAPAVAGGGAKCADAQVTVTWAGTGKCVAHGYVLPTTGRAQAIVNQILAMVPLDAGRTLRLFCGQGGPELHPNTRMDTFVWPAECDRELAVMPHKPFLGRLDILGDDTTHMTVHTATNMLASVRISFNNGRRYIGLATVGGGLSPRHVHGPIVRYGTGVETLDFSADGSVLVATYVTCMVRFFATSTGELLASVPYTTPDRQFFGAHPILTVTVRSAATANKHGTALSTVDTLLCMTETYGRHFHTVHYMSVVFCNAPTQRLVDQRAVNVDTGLKVLCNSGGRRRAMFGGCVILSEPGGPQVSVCATLHLTTGRPSTTHIEVVSLQTGHILKRLRTMDGVVHVVPAACCLRTFWIVQAGSTGHRMQRTRLTAARTLLAEGPPLTTSLPGESAGLDTIPENCAHVPHQVPSMLLVASDNAILVRHDLFRVVGTASKAWPLADGQRAVVNAPHNSHGTCNVVRL
jgi:hypothetical protein